MVSPAAGEHEGHEAAPGAFMERQIGHLLRRAYVLARRNSAEALQALDGLSPVQASALAALMGGPLSQAELGRKIDMEPGNTLTLVRRLAGAGLVVVANSPKNGRLSIVALTERGAAAAGRLEDLLASGAARTLAPLEPAARAQLVSLLRRILELED